jgi:hypothetical protein
MGIARKIRLATPFTLAAALLLMGLLSSTCAAAEEENGPICAQVFPCDEDGNLLADIGASAGPCLDVYLAQCEAYQQRVTKEQDMNAQLLALEKENEQLKKRVRALQRKLRSYGL